MVYEPPRYGPRKDTRPVNQRLREALAQSQKEEKVAVSHDEQRMRRIEQHLKNSPTTKLLFVFFFITYMVLFLKVVLTAAGMQMPYIVSYPFEYPLAWYKPEPPGFNLVGYTILIRPLLAMLFWAVVQGVLMVVHRAVTIQRTFQDD